MIPAVSLDAYDAARERAGLVDRPDRGRIVVSGADRASFLQGLLTNDVVALKAGQGCYAAYLTAQGRMIADLDVYELGDVMLLVLPRDVKDAVIAKLDQVIFSEDVQLGDVTDTFAQLSVIGPEAASLVARVLGVGVETLAAMAEHGNLRTPWASSDKPGVDSSEGGPAAPKLARGSASEGGPAAPKLARGSASEGGPAAPKLARGSASEGGTGSSVIVTRAAGTGEPGFDLFVESARGRELRRALIEAGAAEVDADTAEAIRIEAGVPLFHRDMDEETIPLEAGIESRAISFSKGCYVGQEVIIRVLHRGHGRVARRLVGLRLQGDVVPPAGSRIRAGDREIGKVTSSTRSPALQTPIALGYVHRDFVEPGTKVTVEGCEGEVVTLPFVAQSGRSSG
jgi:folate-binding protein YgfZ